MSIFFTEQLIQKATEIFRRDYGLELTRDKTIEYLDSLADLYLVFSEIRSKGWSVDCRPSLREGGEPDPQSPASYPCSLNT